MTEGLELRGWAVGRDVEGLRNGGAELFSQRDLHDLTLRSKNALGPLTHLSLAAQKGCASEGPWGTFRVHRSHMHRPTHAREVST